MKYLLDTHTLLWFLTDNPRLGVRARRLIESGNTLLVSIVSLWEIAIKASGGNLRLAQPFDAMFPEQLDRNGILLLPVTPAHLKALYRLPYHHRDPFDRLIAAQAQAESLPLISVDAIFDAYGLRREW